MFAGREMQQGAGREQTSADMCDDVGGTSLRNRETGESRSLVDRAAAAEKVCGKSWCFKKLAATVLVAGPDFWLCIHEEGCI